MENEDLEKMLPQINVTVPQAQDPVEQENMISDDHLMGIYNEILNDIRKNSETTESLLNNFVEMVINGGDSTTSSKEALVNLVKIQADMADKKSKIADLMTRVKLKERDTFPKYLNMHTQQTNNIAGPTDRRELIKAINKIQKKKKEQE